MQEGIRDFASNFQFGRYKKDPIGNPDTGPVKYIFDYRNVKYFILYEIRLKLVSRALVIITMHLIQIITNNVLCK